MLLLEQARGLKPGFWAYRDAANPLNYKWIETIWEATAGGCTNIAPRAHM